MSRDSSEPRRQLTLRRRSSLGGDTRPADARAIARDQRGEVRSGYDEHRERLALRLIAVSFFVLATCIVVVSVRDLFFTNGEADESVIGIVLAALSLIVMPALAIAKRRTADAMGSPTLRADSREMLLCAWVSAALLGGLVLNAVVGWSWADPLAALAIAAFAVKEGVEASRGDNDD